MACLRSSWGSVAPWQSHKMLAASLKTIRKTSKFIENDHFPFIFSSFLSFLRHLRRLRVAASPERKSTSRLRGAPGSMEHSTGNVAGFFGLDKLNKEDLSEKTRCLAAETALRGMQNGPKASKMAIGRGDLSASSALSAAPRAAAPPLRSGAASRPQWRPLASSSPLPAGVPHVRASPLCTALCILTYSRI